MLAVVNHRQNQHQTTSDYYDTLMDLVSVYEAYGGQLHNPADNILTDGDYAQMTTEQLDAAMRDYAIATIIIENSDDARYSALKKDLRNHYSRGTDQYPRTGTDAYAQLIAHHDDSNMKRRPNRKPDKGGGGRGGKGGRNGGGRGGRNNNSSTGTSVSQITLAQTVSDHFPTRIPSNCIMLDSESTVHVFSNANMLSNIRDADSVLHIISNGGTSESAHQQGTFAGVGPSGSATVSPTSSLWLAPEKPDAVYTWTQTTPLRFLCA